MHVDLFAVIGEAVHDFKHPVEREAPVLLPPGTPVPVEADRQKLGQAFINVVSNAYKYSPKGGAVRVSFPSRLAEDGMPWFGVCVSDSGIGMSAEQLAHMGERFYRADKSGNIPGTGLGMSIVKEIMELMGGSMAVSSELGQGTSVTLWLPARVNATLALPTPA
jgi:signal transduction histidine kinase